MRCELFKDFRLVGGTALSLQLGHRLSVDIDLFTDAPYNSIDFTAIEKYFHDTFPYVEMPWITAVSFGKSYAIGLNEKDAVKLDLFYTDTFIQPSLITGALRMATVDDIVAMKMEVIQNGGRKKDFWDLHEVLEKYSLKKMILLHAQRYPCA